MISKSSGNCDLAMDATKAAQKGIVATPSGYSWMQAGIGLFSRSATSKGGIALIDQGVVSATNFLTGVIIGRACAKEEFGLYMLGFSIVLFVMNLQTSLISTPYMIYSPRLKGSAHARYTGSTLIHQLGLSALIIIILVIGGVVLSFGIGPKGLAPVVWALAVVITFILVREYARRVCFANLQMKTALLLDSCVAIIQISGLILLAHLGFLSAGPAYWVVGAACGLAAVGWLIRMRNTFALQLTRAISDLGRNWSFGKWVFASNMACLMSLQLYPWLLTGFHGVGATGTFAACWGVVALVNPLLLGMGNFLCPKTTRAYAQGPRELRQVVFKTTVFLAAVTIPLCVAILLFGERLLVLIYGSRYAGNGPVISILALGMVALALTIPPEYGLLAIERPDLNFRVNLIALCVTVTLGLWCVKSLGPLGVACGFLIGNAGALTVRYIIFAKVSLPVPKSGAQ